LKEGRGEKKKKEVPGIGERRNLELTTRNQKKWDKCLRAASKSKFRTVDKGKRCGKSLTYDRLRKRLAGGGV